MVEGLFSDVNKHCKKRERSIKIPGHLISSTHGILAPGVSDRGNTQGVIPDSNA